MRRVFTALALIAGLAGPAGAQQIEAQRLFGSADAPVVEIISTTDIEIFAPLIVAFVADNPAVAVNYTVTSTTELYRAYTEQQPEYDLAVSSAMDLQMKLANDGYAARHSSARIAQMPSWAKWRDHLFAFTQEPVVLVLSRSAFTGLTLPATRDVLIRLLRENPEHFRGRIGTYDPNKSGAGYLFATQDARHSDTFWRLSELIGGLDPVLYASSGAMISDLQSGRIIVAYNVLGPYAEPRLQGWPDGQIVELQDHTNVLLRTAFIPTHAAHPLLGAAFLDFLLSERGQRLLASESGLPRIDEAALSRQPHLRPIRLDPGLLVFVDPLKRSRFLSEWTAAVVQP